MPDSSADNHYYSGISSPLQIGSSDSFTWHHSADVVVVGLGAAGVCAALEASENGASVLAIERFEGGGDTALSGGVVYAGGGTRFQREAGFSDDVQNMYNYLRCETQSVVKEATLRRFCEQSVDNLEWLIKNGASFKASLSPVKTSYPSKRYFLYYSGNESLPAYAEQAKPVPRGHRALGKGLSGAALFAPLQRAALDKGMQLLSQARAVRLVVADNGEVAGLELKMVAPHMRQQHRKLHRAAQRWRMYLPKRSHKYSQDVEAIEQAHSQTVYVRARKGVVLAGGGFVFNRPMLKHYAPQYAAAMPLGTKGANGSTIELGASLSGATQYMDNVSAWRFINPPMAWAQGILINSSGQRFVNEQCYGAEIGRAMFEQSGAVYLLLNRQLFYRALWQALPGRIWSFQSLPVYLSSIISAKKGASLAAIAKRLKLSASTLEQTVSAYNRACAGQLPDSFGKAQDFMHDLSKGPYYVIDMSAKNPFFPLPTITLGGLSVDEHSGLVKNIQGEKMSKLYAAGRCAVGVASNSYVSGLSIADCVFSGRRAGQHAARQ